MNAKTGTGQRMRVAIHGANFGGKRPRGGGDWAIGIPGWALFCGNGRSDGPNFRARFLNGFAEGARRQQFLPAKRIYHYICHLQTRAHPHIPMTLPFTHTKCGSQARFYGRCIGLQLGGIQLSRPTCGLTGLGRRPAKWVHSRSPICTQVWRPH